MRNGQDNENINDVESTVDVEPWNLGDHRDRHSPLVLDIPAMWHFWCEEQQVIVPEIAISDVSQR
jgi:hypothetical protein